MRLRRAILVSVLIHVSAAAVAAPQTPEAAPAVIRSETRLVLVDAVVTDKKGNYVRDLNAKDFRVWEDDREQQITTFSFGSDNADASKPRPRYIVLFFDNSTLSAANQLSARDAAAKFIDATAAPDRLMAVINYGGTVRIAQNFTDDAERLKKVVAGVQFAVSRIPTQVAALGAPRLGSAEADWGVRSVLLALRSVARSMASVPGRKTLVLISAGFVLPPAENIELTAAISACNRANVAVYPIDVRGLTPPSFGERGGFDPAQEYRYIKAAYVPGEQMIAQTRGGGGQGGGGQGGGGQGGGAQRPGAPGGGGQGGGGTPSAPPGGRGGGTPPPGGGSGGNTGGRTPAPGTTPSTRGTTPSTTPYVTRPSFEQPRIIPPFPTSAALSQQVLYSLASGTGGFPIVNTNNLLAGLEKIGREQNEYYVLGYTPDHDDEGKCYTLRVKVNRGGTTVRARTGYCNARPADVLKGKPIEKQLESYAAPSQRGDVSASILMPYFFTSDNTARVHATIEIPPGAFQFEKVKGKFHSELNVLGVAYLPDGRVAARFSDNWKLDLDGKKEVELFQKEPVRYENQFEIASGQYTVKVIFTAGGEKVGKVESMLTVEPWNRSDFAMSTVAVSRHFEKVTDMDTGSDAELIEGRTPLVALGMRVTPAGSRSFNRSNAAALYVEIYDPLACEADAAAGWCAASNHRSQDRRSKAGHRCLEPRAARSCGQSGRAGRPAAAHSGCNVGSVPRGSDRARFSRQ